MGKGGGKGNPPKTQPRNLPQGGIGTCVEKYNVRTNNGFPPGTCGGCGAEDHYRIDCPLSPNRGKPFPKAEAKAKAKAKCTGKGRNVGAVDEGEDDFAESRQDAEELPTKTPGIEREHKVTRPFED